MSSQNRFLLPHATASPSASSGSHATAGRSESASQSDLLDGNNQHSIDEDFDSYWEEEARNPHRNRIRIGRQYQATVPPVLKTGDKDKRRLDYLETLSFCPKRSAKLSDSELDHYFKVAKSLNIFASLVETRSLLGRDVTIADLNHIRNKEGLSLASVIQPARQPAANISPSSSQQNHSSSASANQQSPPTNCDNSQNKSSTTPSGSPKNSASSIDTLNPPLMKALSHFISLHHPCHHDPNCKKLLKDFPLDNEPSSAVSITAENLRQASGGYKELKPNRSRSSSKQQALLLQQIAISKEDSDKDHEVSPENQHSSSDNSTVQSPTHEDWTREEVELFSKAIDHCGKNFASIKKEFLPSKSVKSIVEYYYIGSRDSTEPKKKSNQVGEASESCNSHEKPSANNNSKGGNGDGPSSSTNGKNGPSSFVETAPSSTTASTIPTPSSRNIKPNNQHKTISDIPQGEGMNLSKSATRSERDVSLSSTSALNGSNQAKSKNIDARMSVYNFDDEMKEESSPIRFECPRPGAEVKPLKAKPIVPNASLDPDAANSNVGSLKFFMDGQLVLKLNACSEQQGEGVEKCHWVQSGDKVINPSRNKRYSKRATSERSSEQNGSQSNSVLSSNQDDDSKNAEFTGDEDSKESMSSINQNLPQFQHQQVSQHLKNHSPQSKRLKAVKGESNSNKTPSPTSHHQLSQQQILHQQSGPIDYNRLAVNNRMKDRSDNLQHSPVVSQAAMPWLQANSLAVAAALLGGLPFSQAPPPMHSTMGDNSNSNNCINSRQVALSTSGNNNMSSANAINTKPMDLSLEHNPPAPMTPQKPIQKSASRSRRPKNNSSNH